KGARIDLIGDPGLPPACAVHAGLRSQVMEDRCQPQRRRRRASSDSPAASAGPLVVLAVRVGIPKRDRRDLIAGGARPQLKTTYVALDSLPAPGSQYAT